MRAENVLGKKIARLRRERGITQAELAEQLHFTYQAVSNWERGVSEPDSETLVRLAAYFGVSTDELLGAAGERVSAARSYPRAGEGKTSLAIAEQGKVTQGYEFSEKNWRIKSRERGLCVSLVVFTVCALAEIVLSLFNDSKVLLFLSSLAEFAAAVAFIVAAVFFFIVKVPSASVAARTLFIAGIVVSEAAVLALLFLSPENAAAYMSVTLVGLAFGVFRAYLAPFAFRREWNGLLKWYIILISAQLVCAVLSAFLPSAGGQLFFGFAAQILDVAAPWCLYKMLENRVVGIDYAAENRVYRDAWKRNCRFAYLQWLVAAAFIVCLAAMGGLVPALGGYYIVEGVIPFGALPLYMLEFIVFPLGFALCFWLWKAGAKNRAVHWSLFALWAAASLVTFAYLFIFVCSMAGFPYEIKPWEFALCGAAEFVAFAGIVFLFPCKKGACCIAVRAAFCIVALAFSTVCVLHSCFTPPAARVGGPMFLLYGYMLLLFVLSFFLAERPLKAAKRDSTAAAKG